MRAPPISPSVVNRIFVNFPNRLELSFRSVRALPNDSRIGLAWSTRLASVDASVAPVVPPLDELPPAQARKDITILAVSVLPDPDSPEIITACEFP